MPIVQQDLPWETEREFYNLHAESLFSHFKFYHAAMMGNSAEEFLEYIIFNARIGERAKVLDLGCGSGYLVNELSKTTEAWGISTSEKCIEFCRREYPTSKFEVANMESFQLTDLTHVLSLESISYSNIEKTMTNAFSNLLPGGYLYIKDWCRHESETLEQTSNRVVYENYWKHRLITVSEMIGIAEACGFNLVEQYDITKISNYRFFNETISLNQRQFKLPFPETLLALAAEFLFQKPE